MMKFPLAPSLAAAVALASSAALADGHVDYPTGYVGVSVGATSLTGR